MTVAGYTFKDPSLLETALTHSSYANERRCECAEQGMGHTRSPHNERLEFLGDAVLGFIAAEHLYRQYPDMPEGDLTKLRAGYVCERSLAAAARRLGLGESLRLGRGEKAGGGGARDSILADAFEAVLAAMYLDGGLEPCRGMVGDGVLNGPPAGPVRDAKSRLQEVLQGQGKQGPLYRTVSESGPEHRKTFIVEAVIDGGAARGTGHSKKQAEQDAAGKALATLLKDP
ncbi:MAG: ribonuclease III [Oscillospiraceae bacterium]|jgi:ribonuclease-3|nr:ribonuclease III [Oscillospiraceae bacterium]